MATTQAAQTPSHMRQQKASLAWPDPQYTHLYSSCLHIRETVSVHTSPRNNGKYNRNNALPRPRAPGLEWGSVDRISHESLLFASNKCIVYWILLDLLSLTLTMLISLVDGSLQPSSVHLDGEIFI